MTTCSNQPPTRWGHRTRHSTPDSILQDYWRTRSGTLEETGPESPSIGTSKGPRRSLSRQTDLSSSKSLGRSSHSFEIFYYWPFFIARIQRESVTMNEKMRADYVTISDQVEPVK